MTTTPPNALRPLISVVTVCFNAVTTIQGTLTSLQQQSFRDFEWIVIDGGSTDGTVQFLEENRTDIAVLVSEPDSGIYDAMNKGVRHSSGRWVYFLNADDRLADERVFYDVFAAIRSAQENLALVYGNVIYTNGEHTWQRRFHWVNRRTLLHGDLCHQAVFARRELFDRIGPFEVALRINADYDWLLRAFRSGERTLYLERNIAIFFHGGMHTRAPEHREEERRSVRLRFCSPMVDRLGEVALRIELRCRKWLGQTV